MGRYGTGWIILLVLTAIALRPASADDVVVDPPYYTGARSTADGTVDANGRWSGDGNHGFRIGWSIADPWSSPSGLWEYAYTVSGELDASGDPLPLTQDLSHVILQVSDLAGTGSDFESAFTGFNNDDCLDDGEPMLETYSGANPSNPGLPSSLYGLKWEPDGDVGQYTMSFRSTQVPIWGSFYAKTGRDTRAFNLGLDPANGHGEPDAFTTDFSAWVPTPDTDSNVPPEVIPEPGTLALLGGGLALLLRRRRRRLA
ncbi:MAG: PEP-CTERM sorting domain-containing protein [bacterium]